MPHLPLMQELLSRRPPSSRGYALQKVGFDILRSAAITADLESGKPIDFQRGEAEVLLVVILQEISVDDATFGAVAAEIGVELSSRSTADIVVSVPFAGATGDQQQLPITELAASSMVIWEISLRVKEVLDGIGVRELLGPPDVAVRPGSTTFTFGGGTLLVSGIGMAIAAHAALPLGAAASIAYWGGSIVSALGIVELVLNWKKSLAETDKLAAETRKLEAETQKLEAEEQKLEAEEQKLLIEVERATSEVKKLEVESLLNAAQERLMKLDEARALGHPKPAAALLPLQEIVDQARTYQLSPALAAQLINQVVPAVADATKNYPERLTASRGSSGRVVAAGHS